jgi:ribosome biogenesis GTPase
LDSNGGTSFRAHSGGDLGAYGWDDSLESSFTPHRAAGLIPGRVVRVDGRQCELVTGHGPVRADTGSVPPADPLLVPCTGDWAALRPGEPLALVTLLPRRTAIVRSSASRRSHGQILAANVDTVAVTVSAAEPLALSRLERLLALAWESGAQPVLVLTKIDQLSDRDPVLAEVSAIAPGVDVLAVSAVTGESMDVLLAMLSGTVVLIGPSGVGKSTLGNALLGSERLAVGSVRASDGKGRHTTTRRELVALPGGGVLIDTPGLRAVGMWDAGEGLQQVFAEIGELAEECRFRDCSHETEPGCAVLAAVASGALAKRRLDSYRQLVRENEWATSRNEARLRAEHENRYKTISKGLREKYRLRGYK